MVNFKKILTGACFLLIVGSAWCKESGNSILLVNFEDPKVYVWTYQGPQSKVTAKVQSKLVYKSHKALLVDNNIADWGGAGITLPKGKGDWSKMNALQFWAFGTGTMDPFDVSVTDAGDEMFTYKLINDWKGWKQIIIPLKEITPRLDWQKDNIKLHAMIEYPLKEIQICRTGGTAQFYMCFDLIEVVK